MRSDIISARSGRRRANGHKDMCRAAVFLMAWAAMTAMAEPAGPVAALLHEDSAMNLDIMDQGNDSRAMRRRMDAMDMSYAEHRHAFLNLHEYYKLAPTGPSHQNVLTLRTEYALVAADQRFAVTYGAWNSVVIGDSDYLTPPLFFENYVFGFSAGLWSGQWSPRGAPRHFYHRYMRIWRRAAPDDKWRIVGGPFDVQYDERSPISGLQVSELGDRPELQETGALDADAAGKAGFQNDRAFSQTAVTQGWKTAYMQSAANDIRILLDNRPIVSGADMLADGIPEGEPPAEFVPAGEMHSATADLICTYGLTYGKDDSAHVRPRDMYVHVWWRGKYGWKLRLALENTTPSQ